MSGRPSKIWIVAGESSGDLYGAQLTRDLKRLDPSLEIAGMGGAKMREAGVRLLVDSTELGVVGIVEVLGILFKIIRIMLFLVREAEKERPDAVVLIDYPGFNLRLARRLQARGIPVGWYISPQVWAWRKSNIPKLAHYCTKMMVIFPFEPEVYQGTGLDVEFVGHPLVEIVRGRRDPSLIRNPQQVLLLPGSRRSETKRLLYPMLEAADLLRKHHPDLQFIISAPREKVAQDIRRDLHEFQQRNPDSCAAEIPVVYGQTPALMQTSTAGMAASGTVTVECAIAGLPLVVSYRLNPVTFLLARIIIRKLFRNAFTMPNIILNRKLFEEFLQFQVTPEALAGALERILPGGPRRAEVETGMEEMTRELSAGVTGAGENAARCVIEVSRNTKLLKE